MLSFFFLKEWFFFPDSKVKHLKIFSREIPTQITELRKTQNRLPHWKNQEKIKPNYLSKTWVKTLCLEMGIFSNRFAGSLSEIGLAWYRRSPNAESILVAGTQKKSFMVWISVTLVTSIHIGLGVHNLPIVEDNLVEPKIPGVVHVNVEFAGVRHGVELDGG